ncbi:hypothetical protein [Nostoc sp.]|uniref:hypothetical protein n=1 Tax=Nostoc sp. TaxID=1180 RepID=UPI003FA531AB
METIIIWAFAQRNPTLLFSNHYPSRGWKLEIIQQLVLANHPFSNHYPSRGWKYIRDLVKVGVDCAIAFS